MDFWLANEGLVHLSIPELKRERGSADSLLMNIQNEIASLEAKPHARKGIPAKFWNDVIAAAVAGGEDSGQKHARAPGADKAEKPVKKRKPEKIRPDLSDDAVFQRILELCPLPENLVATAEWVAARAIVEKKIADEQFKSDSDRQIRIKRGMKSLNSMRNGGDAQNKTIEYDGTWYIDSSGRIAFTPEGTNTSLYWHETIDGGKAFWREHFTADGKPREKKTGPSTRK